MSCMGRCVKHGCAFSARLIDGTRDEYCPECEIDHLRTALATAQAEREADIVAALGLVAVAFTAQEGWLCVAKQRAELVANEATALAKDLNAAFGSSAIDAQEFPRIVRELKQRAEQAEADMARLNLERLTVMERALKAEAALAQAQAERDEAQQQVAVWETVFRHSPSPVRPVAQPPALPPLPSEVQALRDLCPTPWYVEEVRPGYPDEARVYDARHYGVLKPTCDRPDIRRSLADAIVALVNGRHAEAAHMKLKGGAK